MAQASDINLTKKSEGLYYYESKNHKDKERSYKVKKYSRDWVVRILGDYKTSKTYDLDTLNECKELIAKLEDRQTLI